MSDVDDQSFQGPTRSMSYEPLAPGARPICGVIVRIKHVRKCRATEQIASGDNSVDRCAMLAVPEYCAVQRIGATVHQLAFQQLLCPYRDKLQAWVLHMVRAHV